MRIDGWQYYNHALIPTTSPAASVDTDVMQQREFWNGNGTSIALLARWTSEFDCGRETEWWYVIKDAPFDINLLKAKRRYEINRGIRNFEVRMIAPEKYPEELYAVQVAAFSAYPAKYRPRVEHDEFTKSVRHWEECLVYGAFSRETGELAGYGLLKFKTAEFLEFLVLKTKPELEKYGVNAAIVAEILKSQATFLGNGGILSDGTRSISHETRFQDYLEKYFGFRKAYCRLHVVYNPKIRWVVRLVYPFRSFLKKMDGIGMVHQLNGVLKMEEIVRNQT